MLISGRLVASKSVSIEKQEISQVLGKFVIFRQNSARGRESQRELAHSGR